MAVKLVDVSAKAAEDALVLWGRHVPSGVELGRPVVVRATVDGSAVDVLTDVALWTVTRYEAERLLLLSGGRTEVTRWCEGAEVARVVAPVG